MNDITHKISTLRMAKAQAIVTVSRLDTMTAIQQNQVPKGDVLNTAKAAALLAIKKTSDVIPDCHPMPIEHAVVNFEMQNLEILITVEVKTIYKTGVEVEAMHGASIAALTLYDMLKPIDKGVEISKIKLLEKSGGKSDFKNSNGTHLTAAVIVCSDSVSSGNAIDQSGKIIINKLEEYGILKHQYHVIPDDSTQIKSMAESLSDKNTDLIIFTGGTGLSSRDVTPDAIKPLLDLEINGIMEAARNYGMERMPFSMLSRGVAGLRKNALILTFPGSAKAATEYMNALFPYVLHIFKVKANAGH